MLRPKTNAVTENWFARIVGSIGSSLAAACMFAAAGCAESTPPPPSSPPPAVPTQLAPATATGPALAQVPEASPAQQPPPVTPAEPPLQPGNRPAAGGDASKPRPILGRTTNDIRDAETEQAKGAQRAQSRITAKDPITLTGNAYISIVGRAEQLNMQHTLDLYHAETGRYPKDLNEFMREIVKKSGVRLAQLPYYQEYAYDAANHQLVILEYPDRKESGPGR